MRGEGGLAAGDNGESRSCILRSCGGDKGVGGIQRGQASFTTTQEPSSRRVVRSGRAWRRCWQRQGGRSARRGSAGRQKFSLSFRTRPFCRPQKSCGADRRHRPATGQSRFLSAVSGDVRSGECRLPRSRQTTEDAGRTLRGIGACRHSETAPAIVHRAMRRADDPERLPGRSCEAPLTVAEVSLTLSSPQADDGFG